MRCKCGHLEESHAGNWLDSIEGAYCQLCPADTYLHEFEEGGEQAA